ncbi:UNVERIFIED_CONTAM: hypothetical protein Slati_1137400 [Sesamum latifolium]|uniref:Uncharacterized protein n=1 Tax=Sesamum latifolium TaxID=2727402 RepID=A0AAW2XD44_9LAMI
MYDNAMDQAFIMRAVLMWTVNDLPAYGLASEWSTAGIMGCPTCMDGTWVFHLQHGRKAWYFDCHRKFLPKDHPDRRNKKAFTKNRMEYKIARLRLIREQIRDWVADFSLVVEQPLTLPSIMVATTSGLRKISFGIFHTGQRI